jgi:hypothetical protein
MEPEYRAIDPKVQAMLLGYASFCVEFCRGLEVYPIFLRWVAAEYEMDVAHLLTPEVLAVTDETLTLNASYLRKKAGLGDAKPTDTATG